MRAYYGGEILQVIIKMTTQNTPFLGLLISEVSQFIRRVTKEIVKSLSLSLSLVVKILFRLGPLVWVRQWTHNNCDFFICFDDQILFISSPSHRHLLSITITGLTVLVQCSLHVWDNISFPTVLWGGREGGGGGGGRCAGVGWLNFHPLVHCTCTIILPHSRCLLLLSIVLCCALCCLLGTNTDSSDDWVNSIYCQYWILISVIALY